MGEKKKKVGEREPFQNLWFHPGFSDGRHGPKIVGLTFVLYCYDKTLTKSILGRKSLFGLHFYITVHH